MGFKFKRSIPFVGPYLSALVFYISLLNVHDFLQRKVVVVWASLTVSIVSGYLFPKTGSGQCSLKLQQNHRKWTLQRNVHSNQQEDRAGIFKQSMGARNRGGIVLSYRPARLHRLAEFIPWNRLLGSINV